MPAGAYLRVYNELMKVRFVDAAHAAMQEDRPIPATKAAAIAAAVSEATDEEVEHAQLLAVLDRIHRRNEAARVRTRLPAGLSEDELARGYAPCAGGA